jgi:diacylglycerol diphosphate phosphatase / phosphatidate phosphatase
MTIFDRKLIVAVWLVIIAGIVPLGVLVSWAALFRPGLHKAHVTILGLFIRYVFL